LQQKVAGQSAVFVGRASAQSKRKIARSIESARPVPRMARAMAAMANAAPAPTEEFTPQSVTVNAHVNAVFTLK
jgi:uncharacterized protein YggE